MGLGSRLGLGVELGPHLDKLVELFHGDSRVHVARGELMEVLEDDRREELRAGADDAVSAPQMQLREMRKCLNNGRSLYRTRSSEARGMKCAGVSTARGMKRAGARTCMST
jgi:hypothetical protein